MSWDVFRKSRTSIVLGGLGAVVERSWVVLGNLGVAWGSSWERLEAVFICLPGIVLDWSAAVLGLSWGCLGIILGLSAVVLEMSCDGLRSWAI